MIENIHPSGYFLTDFQRKLLRKHLQTESRPPYRQRIEIMLKADSGRSQTEICSELGCSQETARYWIAMARAGQAHQWQERPVGRPKTVNEEYLASLQELVSHSPRDYGYSFRSWTARWLSEHLSKQFDIECSPRHINRLLRQMGLSTRLEKTESGDDRTPPGNPRIVIGDLTPAGDSPLSTYRFLPG